MCFTVCFSLSKSKDEEEPTVRGMSCVYLTVQYFPLQEAQTKHSHTLFVVLKGI